MIVEKMIVKQYRVRYRDNQYTKVNTVNMVLANSADLRPTPRTTTSP